MENCMKRFSLENRIIIITGAAGLLGRMHTRAVLDADGIPVMLDIDANKLEEAAKEICKDYKEKLILSYAISITDKKQIEQVLSDIVKKYGRLDGLINNACNNPTMKDSSLGQGRFESFNYKEWLEDVDVGLYLSLIHI